MGQFDSFIEHTSAPPPTAMRIFQLVMPVVMVARAIAVDTLENVLWAIFFVVLMLPAGIAPKLAPPCRGYSMTTRRTYDVPEGEAPMPNPAAGS